MQEIENAPEDVNYICFPYNWDFLLYRGKEEIHSEIELVIFYWHSLTNIISLALLVLRPKLVLLLTEIFQYRRA